MRRFLLSAVIAATSATATMAQDTLWVQYDNRFTDNKSYPISSKVDSVEFCLTGLNLAKPYPILKLYNSSLTKGYSEYRISTLVNADMTGKIMFQNPGRILFKPSSLSSLDFTNPYSQWCFKRSMESEHFVVFWESGFGDDPTKAASGYAFNPKTMLANAEKYWDKYVELGFVTPGKSTTDKYKIEMFANYTSEWVANGSGQDFKVGTLNVSPWAISSRGGATVAHEIGHTFQYLVSCDLGTTHGFNYGYGTGASGGNGWWESCANWQAYKCYPAMQFTDGENFEGHLRYHHLNLLHEEWRYQNCFIHDYWCMKHGNDFIGRLWRESIKPEDPVEAYKRLNGLDQDAFCNEQMEGYMRMATWDIDGVRDAAKHRIGQHVTHLHLTADNDGTWEVDSAYCPQNYGYSIINLNTAAPGTVVKANFKGIAGAAGYRAINVDKAGWRYGFVAYANDGTRTYGNIESAADGVATLTVPEGCTRLFFVVMGAPTEHWRHPWDDNASNDEQWPYQVKFENTDVYGNFNEYPADYVPRDTTIYIDAELAVSNSYSSTRVQYDMAAVSQALGLSTKQMQSVGRSATSNPRFVGIDANGTIHTGTTTSTSSSTVYGHWFNSAGNVCNYDDTACIFAEFYPDKYGCYVGQYPSRLTKGKTYTIRQGIQYQKDGKWYTATMVVRLKAI